LALAVRSIGASLEVETFVKARERIREEIRSANSDEDNSYDRGTMSRTIDVMATYLETMATLLGKSSVSSATAGLLKILPGMSDYLAREAIAGALETLAPQMSDDDRKKALSAAKFALAKTGSVEEATAWAGAVAALLPADCDKFTRGIVEVLKYPNTAGEPQTEVLLKALTQCWYDDKTVIDAIMKKRVTDKPCLSG
jgi:hypothetical protein